MYAELGLGDREVDDDEAIALMAEHPELMQRPVVVRGDRAVLARPVERVDELLDDYAVPVAVVDLGTNTTRLLVAEVEDGAVEELERRTTITSLGQGVDATGRLADEAMDRVREALAGYREVIDRLGVDARLRRRHQRHARRRERARVPRRAERALRHRRRARSPGTRRRGSPSSAPPRAARDDRETGRRDRHRRRLDRVRGRATRARPDFHVSTQMGSVRHTERFLHSDPPRARELEALAEDVGARSRTRAGRTRADAAAIAVAGTATTLAAIDQELDPYDPRRSTATALSLAAGERIQAMLAALPLDERREVKGLHPDRAPTIVAGVDDPGRVDPRASGSTRSRSARRDILHGAALAASNGGLRQQENRPHHAGGSQNGPIRTGRGTCHERALRFGRREAPIRCGFARTYVPGKRQRVCRTASPPSGATINQMRRSGKGRRCCPGWRSGEIRLARVDDRRIGEHVHERRLAGCERALQRGPQLVGLARPARRARRAPARPRRSGSPGCSSAATE